MTHGVGKLYLEQTGRDIEHALLVIGLLTTHTNGIDQVGLSAARGTIDKERIKGGLARMLCDRESDGTRQFVAVAFDIVLESLLRIELGIQLLRSHRIQCRGRLVDTARRLGLFNRIGTLALHLSHHVVTRSLDLYNTIAKLDFCTKHSREYLT